MATFRRGRNNKSELNLTSSFIAGGSQYYHHSGSLLAFYRFEEPYALTNPGHLSSSHFLRVEDSSGYERYAQITSGSIHSEGAPAEAHGNPVPHRTAISTPYNFRNGLTTQDTLGGPDRLIQVDPATSNQIRVLEFTSGTSERVELPRQLARALTNNYGTARPFPHREVYESGMTFAGWVKMQPVTASFSFDTQSKASVSLYLRGHNQIDLHGETLELQDANSRSVTFEYSRYQAGNMYVATSGKYSVGLGGYPDPITHLNHRDIIQSAIEKAVNDGAISLEVTNPNTSTQFITRRGKTCASAKITIDYSNLALDDEITLSSPRLGSSTFICITTGTPSTNKVAGKWQFLKETDANQTAYNLWRAIYVNHVENFSSDWRGGFYYDFNPSYADSGDVYLTQWLAGPEGNTSIAITSPAGGITAQGDGFDPDSNRITTANKFTGGRDSNATLNYALLNLTQGQGGLAGNTAVTGSVFDNNVVDGPAGYDTSAAYVSGSAAAHTVLEDFFAFSSPTHSKTTLVSNSEATDSDTLTFQWEDRFGDQIEAQITFNDGATNNTTWTGSKTHGASSTYTAVIRGNTATANIANAIRVLLASTSPSVFDEFTISGAGSTIIITADVLDDSLDLTTGGSGADHFNISQSTYDNKGSFTGGAGPRTGGQGVVSEKYITKSIFTTITGTEAAVTTTGDAGADGNARFGGGPADKTEEGSDATGLSLRVISSPNTNKHNTLSWLATHFSGSSSTAEAIEWRTSNSLPEDKWAHVAVVYPMAPNLHEYGLHTSDLKNSSSPVEPKIFVNGVKQTIQQIPRTTKARAGVQIEVMPETSRGIQVSSEATGSVTNAIFQYDTTSLGGSPWRSAIQSLAPDATIVFDDTSNPTHAEFANHMSTWDVTLPNEGAEKFMIDGHHSGSYSLAQSDPTDIKLHYEQSSGVSQRLQKVSPNVSDLAKIHIRYGGLFSATGTNPGDNRFIRFTTPNLTTKTYKFTVTPQSYTNNVADVLTDTLTNSNALPMSIFNALHSSSSLSHGFRIGRQTVIGAVLTTQPAYNMLGLDMGTTDATDFGHSSVSGSALSYSGVKDARDGGEYVAGSAMHSVPQGTPIIVFGPDGNQSGVPSSANNFISERYIEFDEKITSNAWVFFKAFPGQSSGGATTTIHPNMLETPDTGEDFEVQVSVDRQTWYGPTRSVDSSGNITSFADNDAVEGVLPHDAATNHWKKYVSGSGAQKISRYGNPSYDRHQNPQWNHYGFYCNFDSNSDRGAIADIGGANGSNGNDGYYVRIIQKGYSGYQFDQWALCDITIHGVTQNYYGSTAGVVPVEITTGDPDNTFANLCAAITGSTGHGSEVMCTQDTINNVVTITFNSPVGRIESGETAGKILTSTYHAGSTNSIALSYAMRGTTSVALENFDVLPDANYTHWRLGLKGAATAENVRDYVSSSLGSIASSQFRVGGWFYGNDVSTDTYELSANRPGSAVLSAPVQDNTFFGSGSSANGWSVTSWSAVLGSTVPIGDIFTSGSTTSGDLAKVAARTAEVAHMLADSGSLNAKPILTSSLSKSVVFEQSFAGPTSNSTKLQVVDNNLDPVLGGSPWANMFATEPGLKISDDAVTGGNIFQSTILFSGGDKKQNPPRGALVPGDLMYMGTPPQLLNLFDKQSHPYGLDRPPASDFADLKHKLGGRSPKASFDDIAFWRRCLSDEEINALYGAKDGTFTPKSGFLSNPPRVVIREDDEMNHQYPTISRFGDKDFGGRYNLFYDSSYEQVYHDPYATAEIVFRGRPRDGTWIQLSDWAGRTLVFEFNYGKIVRPGNVEVAIHDQRTASEVAKKMAEVINAQTSFGIRAEIGSKKQAVLLKQTKAGTEGNTSIKNSQRHAIPKLRKKIRAQIPSQFTGGTTSPKVVFPYRLEEGHPLIRESQPTPNAASSILVSGSSHKNAMVRPLQHVWEDESISPFDEGGSYAAFGSEVNVEADDLFTTDGDRDQQFFSTGTLPTHVGHGLHGPLWSKRKIEIGLKPKSSTTLHGHIVTGSTMAYFNFDKNVWEPIGHPGTGSYYVPVPGTNAYVSGVNPQASIYSVSASSIDGESASHSGFRQWMDSMYVGFSPSIGMMVAKSDGSVSSARAPGSDNTGKYVFVDGGISTPVSTFGFPFHPKYHATSSQYLKASDYIDRPFLLEKIVYEFEASIPQSSSIDVRTGGSGNAGTGSYGSAGSYNQHAYVNSPTPTFFMLNQRTAALPDTISNKINIATIVDGENRQLNFHYTASIPSRFYLAQTGARSDRPEYVNTIRDMVTFGRLGVFSARFDESDFESYVPDPREKLDTVLTPAISRQANFEAGVETTTIPATKLTLALPARAPKVNPSVTTFKTEGDFFGNVSATTTISIDGIPSNASYITLTDADGDTVYFVFRSTDGEVFNTATTPADVDTTRFVTAASNSAFSQDRWEINTIGLTTVDDRRIIAARLYEAIERATRGESGYNSGNFVSGMTLQKTGSVDAANFTITQVVGGTAGNRSNYHSSTAATVGDFSGGQDINDDIVLSWQGGRSGTGLMSGRSPFGGEYGAYSVSYTTNNNTQTHIVSHSAEDNLISPYLIMPGDKLIFGWQSPIGTGSMVYHGISENDGTFQIMKDVGKIVLYGSVLRDEREDPVNTSNQPLTSNALHEALHYGAEVFDQYDTDPPMFHSGTYLDNFVTGSMLRTLERPFGSLASHITSHRKVVSRGTSGNHAIGPKSNSSRIYHKRSSFLRGVKVVDARERWYDSMLPDVADLLKVDGKRLFSPSFGDTASSIGNSKGAALVLGHPKVATGSSTSISPNDQVWSSWFGAFPFEPRYNSASRTAGLKTKDVVVPSASGSVDLGTKQLVHVWLANVTGSITPPGGGVADDGTFGIADPNISTVSTDMLNIIDMPNLISYARDSADSAGIHVPKFSNFAIVTNDHGHGYSGEKLDVLRFSKTFGSPIYGSLYETNAEFFAKVLFGSGDGSFKFPKLPFWKSVGMQESGYDATDTFAVTKGVIIRGFRYGLANVLPKFSAAVYRRDKFGHVRDMLEQRQFTRFFTEDGLEEGVVTVSFVERGSNSSLTTEPGSTNSANLDHFCSSSMPYRDGHALDRFSEQPDTTEKVSISIDVGLD